MKALSKTLQNIDESPLTGFDALVKKMKKSGRDIIALNVGQPDFDQPKAVKMGIERTSAVKGFNFYTPVAGSEEIRSAISIYHDKMFGVKYDPKCIILTNGAKEAVALSIAAIAGPGDEVILIAPYWSTYRELIRLFGAVPVVVDTKEDSHLDMKRILSVITAGTKAIIINSPNNPSGAVYSKKELAYLVDIAAKNDLYIISDEIYNSIVFGKEYISCTSIEGASRRTVTINGFSKSASVTGYRLGYAASENPEIMNGMLKIKSNFSGNSNSFFQEVMRSVIVDQFDDLKVSVENMKSEFLKRRKYLSRELCKMGFKCVMPQGSFYVWSKIPAKIGMQSEEFSRYMLEHGVAITPGVFFGESYDGYVRISFAESMENLEKAVKRIQNGLE